MSENNSIGALWTNEGSKGIYMTGNITILGETVKIVVFHNDRKQEGDKFPDWRIYISKPKEEPNQEKSTLEPF